MQKPCVVNIMVGNKELLKSTHSGSLRLGNIVFVNVFFVPGLLQTLISEPQMELKGCRIVSEKWGENSVQKWKFVPCDT